MKVFKRKKSKESLVSPFTKQSEQTSSTDPKSPQSPPLDPKNAAQAAPTGSTELGPSPISKENQSTQDQTQHESPPGSPHLVSHEGLELYRHYTREDRYMNWFYRPHTLIMLSLAGVALIFLAIVEPTQPSIEARVKT